MGATNDQRVAKPIRIGGDLLVKVLPYTTLIYGFKQVLVGDFQVIGFLEA